jgi:hypothetical protein
MLIEVLQPLETHLVICPPILGCGDSPIGREAASFVPVTKVFWPVTMMNGGIAQPAGLIP